MKRIKSISKLLKKSEFRTKVLIYFSTKAYGNDYDPYEGNATLTNLNPKTIYAYVSDITPEALVWKQYGLSQIGAKEILCDKKYRNWFEKANKITIEGNQYSVFMEGTGSKAIITERQANLIRVVLTRKE